MDIASQILNFYGVYRNHPVNLSVGVSSKRTLLLSVRTDTVETLHSCSIQSEDVHEGE